MPSPVPYNYDVHSQCGFVLVRCVDSRWTGRDVVESVGTIVTDDRFAPDYDWIYDMRFVHETVITTAGMNGIVEQVHRLEQSGQVDPDSRAAIVGTDDNLRFTGALYQQKADRPEGQLAVVDTLDEALNWLGVDREAVETLSVDARPED